MKIVCVVLAILLGLAALFGIDGGALTPLREVALGVILAALAVVVP